MEEVKTYTKRVNARRAGVQAGIPSEQVEITVHKNGDEVRFGFKKGASPAMTTATEAAPKVKKEAAPKVERVQQNGVKRPAPGGLCAAVWEHLDANPGVTVKELRDAAPGKGWNPTNASCEFYAWRKFMGITGRAKTE